MADDQTQRAYRASQPPVRNAPSAASATANASDPLAELARLIGQNDPFAEYGRDGGRRAAAMQAGVPADYAPAHDLHAGAAPAYAEERYAAAPGYAEEPYDEPAAQTAPFPPPAAPPPRSHYAEPTYGDADYAADPNAQGVIPGQAEQAGYEQAAYYPNNPQSDAEQEHFYDDVPPRRRVGILAIAAVFALAVIGTAGAFGYRTLFGSSGPSGPPPVIKADATPSKIVPATDSKDPKSGKLIHDRVNNGQNEKLVSREEQPVGIKDNPVGAVLPQGRNGAPGGAMQQAALGSGVIGVEPKKIHTIAIHPNQTAGSTSGPPPAAAPAPMPAPPAGSTSGPPPAAAPAPMPAPAPAHAQPAAPAKPPRTVAEPAPRPVAHTEAPARRAAAPSNAPLSLNPNAPAAAAPARTTAQRTTRTAAAAPTPIAPARTAAPTPIAPTKTAAPTRIAPASSSGGGYAVQIVSRHNEADAQASFHSLQAKYPQQLGGRAPLIRRVDLGAKGIYYRAMVGPFGSAEEASQVCSSLKAAGGDCLVQRI